MDNNEFLSRMQMDFSDYDGLDIADDMDSLDWIGQDSPDISDAPIIPDFNLDNADVFDTLADLEIVDDMADPDVSDKLAGVSVSLDFDMEELSSDFEEASAGIAVVDDDSAVDAKLLYELLDECTQLGFSVNDSNNLKHVQYVHSYAKQCTAKHNYADFYEKYYPDMLNSLASSSSLYVTQETNIKQFKAKILKCLKDKELQEAGGVAINAIYEQLLKLRQEKNITSIDIWDIDKNAVWKSLVTNRRLVLSYLLANEASIKNFIDTAINTLIENEISSVLNNQADESRRVSMSCILTEDVRTVTKYLREFGHAYIKRMDASDGGDIHCICSECGGSTKVSSLMHFVFFQQGGKTQSYVYPANNRCSCGKVLVFPAAEYVLARNHYIENNKATIRATLERTKNFSRGSAVVTVTPALAQLPPEITCIVSDVNADWEDTLVRKSVEVFDSNEWMRAVKEFYDRIELMDGFVNTKSAGADKPESDTVLQDRMSNYDTEDKPECSYEAIRIPEVPTADAFYISVLAANVAQIAGVNYNTVKGKAFLSLINFLHENSIVDFYMNFDNVISANAALKLVDGYGDGGEFDLNRLDRNVFDNLMLIAASLDPEVKTPQDKNDIRVFFTEHYEELKDKVASTNSTYSRFIDALWISRYALASLPITDYRQDTVYSIIHFLVDERVFSVVNEICDRMVINNYVSKYFEFWARNNMPHVRNFKKKLYEFSDVTSIKSTMRDIFHDVFSEYGVTPSECYFDNVTIQSMDSWQLLQFLSDIIESGNYYRFCREAQKIRDSKYGFGYAFDNALREFRNNNYAEFVHTTEVSEIEFYLGSMFTSEELADGADSLEYVVFGRYIPIRRNGESVTEYADRFRSADFGECFDNMERFKKLEGLQYVHFGSAVVRAKQGNFRVSSFVAGMMDSVINSGTSVALGLIGVSELRYSTLVQKTKTWTFSDFNINNADIVALLNSYYFTDAGDAMVETFSAMCNSYFTASDNVIPLSEIFDFDECLLENLKDIASNPDGMDLTSMVEEMRRWEYTKRYVERFVDG